MARLLLLTAAMKSQHSEPRTAVESEVARSAHRVLVAEDSAEFRRLIANALRHDGFDVIEAKSGAELIERISIASRDGFGGSPPYDLIISDLRMPVASGVEVLSKLRSEARSTPFILMTAFGAPELHEEAKRLGANAVLDKPFDLADLRTMALLLSGRA